MKSLLIRWVTCRPILWLFNERWKYNSLGDPLIYIIYGFDLRAIIIIPHIVRSPIARPIVLEHLVPP